MPLLAWATPDSQGDVACLGARFLILTPVGSTASAIAVDVVVSTAAAVAPAAAVASAHVVATVVVVAVIVACPAVSAIAVVVIAV